MTRSIFSDFALRRSISNGVVVAARELWRLISDPCECDEIVGATLAALPPRRLHSDPERGTDPAVLPEREVAGRLWRSSDVKSNESNDR